MTTLLKNSDPHNEKIAQSIRSVALGAVSTKYHVDKGSVGSDPYLVTAADGDGTAPKLLALAQDIVAKYLIHTTDTNSYGATGTAAHKVIDTTLAGTVTVASITSVATANTALNAVKAAYNTHIASTTYHYTADSTNSTAATDATNQATGDTLANELKADFNAHIASGVGDCLVLRSV